MKTYQMKSKKIFDAIREYQTLGRRAAHSAIIALGRGDYESAFRYASTAASVNLAFFDFFAAVKEDIAAIEGAENDLQQ